MIVHKADTGSPPIDQSRPFRLGDATVDPDRNSIAHDDDECPIEPRVMEVLLYLCARPGQVVSKHELIAAVWRTNVVDEAVHRAVSLLRSALRDSPHHPAVIETVPRRGYRLMIEPRSISAGVWPRIVAQRFWLLAAALAAAMLLTLPLADGGRKEERQGTAQPTPTRVATPTVSVNRAESAAVAPSPLERRRSPPPATATPRAAPAALAPVAPATSETPTPHVEAPVAEPGENAPVAPQD